MSSLSRKKISWLIALGLLLGQAATPSFATSSVPAKSGYFPIELQNNIGSGSSSQGVKDVYLLFSGQQAAKPNPACVMNLTQDTHVTGYNAWKANCVTLALSTQASQYAYPMSKLQAQSGEPVLIYMPNVISGRAFVSLNHPLDLPMTKAADGSISFQEPSLSNPTDGNYNLIYDKFEYTYDNTNTFWIDTTSVDDFSLPIALSYYNSSADTTTLNGYTGQSRGSIISGIQSILQSDGNPDWQNLFVKDNVSGTGTIMRVDAPNTAPSFNASYFTSANGFNYKKTLIQYYGAGNTLKINCGEVDSAGYPEYAQLGSGTDKAAYHFTGTVNSTGHFIFNNDTTIAAHKMTVDVDLTDAHSIDFFGPGQAPFDTPNGTVRSVIVKNLTAAASAGLIPASSGTYLNDSYFSNAVKNNLYYKQNSILASQYNAYTQANGIGPWYNLYAKAIHKTAANPVYAFAYDDVLKQDGTISVPNSSSGASVQPVVITLGSVGDLKVPSPGPNYNPNPPANDVYPVNSVQQTNFSCASGNCTISASWKLPSQQQDAAVKYFILPQPSPGTATVLKPQVANLANYNATSMSITYPVKPAPPMIQQITVYACIPSNDLTAKGYDCPSVGNNYTFGGKVQGASSEAQGVVLAPVTPVSNSGFSCNSNGKCSLNAIWTIPASEPSGTQFYILPMNNSQASIVDILEGQPMGTGSSATLTLPKSDVTNVNAPIIIMACINNAASGKYCPNSGNSYNQSTGVGSTQLNPTN